MGRSSPCFELRPAIPGSVGETLPSAAARESNTRPPPRVASFASSPTAVPSRPRKRGSRSGQGRLRHWRRRSRLGKHLGSVWGRGDPAAAADEAAAEAAKAEALLETLGSKQLRAARTRTLQKALGPMRPFRAVGVNYKRDDEMRAHYIQTRLPDLADALIHIDMTDALMPLDLTPEWVAGHQQIQQAAMHARPRPDFRAGRSTRRRGRGSRGSRNNRGNRGSRGSRGGGHGGRNSRPKA